MTIKVALAVVLAALAASGHAHPSRGIVATADGSVYFSDLERLWRITPDGRLIKQRERRNVHNHALTLDYAGNVIGEDSTYNRSDGSYRGAIWSLAPNGRFRYLYGPAKVAVRGVGIHRDRRGCTFHADQTGPHRRPLVHRRCADGQVTRLLGSAADDRSFQPELLNDVAGSALAAGGSFVFRQGSSLRRIDPSGRVTLVASGLADENFGIAFDPDGRLLVAEATTRRVVQIAGDGRKTLAASSKKPWFPTGVAASRGALYVLEATDYVRGTPLRMRVRRVGLGGASRTLATVTIPAA